ncbi:PREDICTED: uncharacterized protein LOC108373502 [Rhagoletis zephyria]|uniref:uncharacterized protein LOC108373502 n=1 Tax=Rhagoletis zephyria TaxID=28612 RepID=UPI000811320C|nr:PREDICTED: uncharacterized protein LOC108373502 [Rhagoletis zephyria]
MQQRQIYLQRARECMRNQRQKQRAEQRQQFTPQFSSVLVPSYFQRLSEDVSARRRQEKLPKTYCGAHLFLKDDEIESSCAERMEKICEFCSAKLYPGEAADNTASICCHICLPPISVRDELKELIERNDGITKNYLENIRKFNNGLAFATVQVNFVNIPGRGPFCFKLE